MTYETATHLFVRASDDSDLPMDRQRGRALRWDVLNPSRARPEPSGRVVVCGHTQQTSGDVLDLGFVRCIDTACDRGGWLRAREVDTGEVIRANQQGENRRGWLTPKTPEGVNPPSVCSSAISCGPSEAVGVG
jgi:serine/threonine protein phosphatase 1